MLRLTKRRREVLAEKFGDLANLAIAGLFFGQALAGDTFRLRLALAGMGIWAALLALTYVLVEPER